MMRIVALTLMLFCVATAHAQFRIAPGGTPRPLGKDTICFRYDFRAGDTLVYDMQGFDSIAVDKSIGESFRKQRVERIRLVCDSVSRDGVMYLTRQLLAMREENYRLSPPYDTTRRAAHPWTSRIHRFAIDTLGHRRWVSMHDERLGGVSPGGIFHPQLVPIIDSSCGRQNQTWLSIDTVMLVENASPSPVLVQQNYWRVVNQFDTLGRSVKRLQYTQSGIGAYEVAGSDVDSRVTSVLASFGVCTFDRTLNVILHQYVTSEIKFTAITAGREATGKHYVTLQYSLRSLRARDPQRRWEARK
jgi:hypothetical protein